MSNKKRHMPPVRRGFWAKHHGDILTALVLIPLALLAIWTWGGHLRLNENANAGARESGATNPIGLQQSSHPTDTDIANLQAAEKGALNQPALIWFHADW